MDGVLHESHHVAKIRNISFHQGNSNPNAEQGDAVEKEAEKRADERHDFVDADDGGGEFGIGGGEFAFLEFLVVEGADNAEASEVFAGKKGDFVEKFLEKFELFNDRGQNDGRENEHDADGKGDNPGHIRGGGESLEESDDGHHWRAEHH